MEKEKQPSTTREELLRKAQDALQTFHAMENIHDIIKSKSEKGELTSSEAARMVRLVRVFEWNTLQVEKSKLEFGKWKNFDNEDLDAAIRDAHEFMMKLPIEIWEDWRKYLDAWNKTIYEKYLNINRMRLELLRKEIDWKKKQQSIEKENADDILRDM